MATGQPVHTSGSRHATFSVPGANIWYHVFDGSFYLTDKSSTMLHGLLICCRITICPGFFFAPSSYGDAFYFFDVPEKYPTLVK